MDKTVLARQAVPDEIVATRTARNHLRIRDKTLKTATDGQLVFHSIFPKDGIWIEQKGDILFSPNKELLVIAPAFPEPVPQEFSDPAYELIQGKLAI